MRLKDVSRRRIKKYYNHLADECHLTQNKGLSNNTIKKHHAILSYFFKECLEDELITKDPTLKLKTGKINKKRNKVLDLSELNILFNYIEGNVYETGIYLATLGLRRSEIIGLKWKDIDFKKSIIHITRARLRCKESKRNDLEKKDSVELVRNTNTYTKNYMKNTTSRRDVPFPKYTREQLYKERKKQKMFKKFFSNKYIESSFVCVKDNGVPYDPERLSDNLPVFCERAGIKRITLHGLRHTYATQQRLIGNALPVVKKLLGHSSITTTVDTYGHINIEEMRIANNKLDEKLEEFQIS